MISIVSYHYGLQGSIINLLDLNDYLSDYKEVNFYCRNKGELLSLISKTRRNYKTDNFFNLKRLIISEIIITDFKSLIFLSRKFISLYCSKLIILDTVELSYHLKNITTATFFRDVEVDLKKILSLYKFNEIVFLMPPYDYNLFISKYEYNVKINFKQINTKVLSTAIISNNKKLMCRNDKRNIKSEIEKKYNNVVFYDSEEKIFDFSGFIYFKREFIQYFEQFGRTIFEFLLLEKDVYFFDNPFDHEDCLKEYLNHYEVKVINEKAVVNIEEFRNKMEMKWNLLEEIS